MFIPEKLRKSFIRMKKILEAAVIGVKDAIKGEVVKAVVAIHSGIEATEEELIRFCASRLAKFKVPKIVEIRKELPKSSTGKILRRLLR